MISRLKFWVVGYFTLLRIGREERAAKRVIRALRERRDSLTLIMERCWCKNRGETIPPDVRCDACLLRFRNWRRYVIMEERLKGMFDCWFWTEPE